jgi:hypothetical protein
LVGMVGSIFASIIASIIASIFASIVNKTWGVYNGAVRAIRAGKGCRDAGQSEREAPSAGPSRVVGARRSRHRLQQSVRSIPPEGGKVVKCAGMLRPLYVLRSEREALLQPQSWDPEHKMVFLLGLRTLGGEHRCGPGNGGETTQTLGSAILTRPHRVGPEICSSFGVWGIIGPSGLGRGAEP